MNLHVKFFRIRQAFILLLGFLLVSSCDRNTNYSDETNSEYATYITAFTGGIISANSSILIELSQDIPNAVEGEEASPEAFKFKPALEGKLIWKNPHCLEFKPTALIPQGTSYQVNFALHSFMEVPDHLKTFRFHFQTLRQFAAIHEIGNEFYDTENPVWMKFKGRISTNDAAEPKLIEEMFHATLHGKSLKVSWEHASSATSHVFTIDSIERTNKTGELFLEANPDLLGAKQEQLVLQKEIPAIQDFKMMTVRASQAAEQSITVYFSDPLNPGQDITGFFRLSDQTHVVTQMIGNAVIVYPQQGIQGSVSLIISPSLENADGKALGREIIHAVSFADQKPMVQFIGKGVIIPGSKGFKLPFKAVNLRAVEVKIVKIFEDNVLQFLQNNSLDGENELKRVGRLIFKQDIPLISDKEIDLKQWNTFALQLDELIDTEPGAIYRVYIDFKMKHSLYDCENQEDNNTISFYSSESAEFTKDDEPNRYYYYDEESWDYSEYDYNESDNPCHISYYMFSRHTISQNIMASNLGITAKEDENEKLKIIVNDLVSSEPLEGVEVELYNFQQRIIGKGKTNNEGIASIEPTGKGIVVIAKHGKERAYLRIDDASARSLSMFQVGGQQITLGMKGFIYTERGVWRPGDSIYTTLVIENKQLDKPVNQPVTFELYTPDNQLYQKKVSGNSINGFYAFHTATEKNSPTGNWTLYAKAGNAVYSKTLKIETIKPNRLKIELNFPNKVLSPHKENKGQLLVKWLHGADASNLRAVVDMQLQARAFKFKSYEDFSFDDPTKFFLSDERRIFDAKLNEKGEAQVVTDIFMETDAPGMLIAKMKIRAFENGGDFSTQLNSVNYSPYVSYAGVKIPKGKGWGGALLTDEANLLPIVTLDENGNPVDRKDVKVEIYEMDWRWWWEQSDDEYMSEFISKEGDYLIKTDYISTKGGKANYELKFNQPSWGRKMIRVTDPVSGHTSGAMFYTTYANYYNTSGENTGGAEMLTITTDKEEYQTGETVTVVLPAFKSGRALVALESGNEILDMFWSKPTTFSFKVTPEMAPNLYIEVSYMQPQDHPDNDYPIRMYGVKNINVYNPESKLEPVLNTKDEWAPLTDVSITVSEQKGKAMTYTLAVVDDGLLDLTSFKTPDLWNHFYEKEALGVKTWDMYPYVMGAHKGELAGLLAIGGGEGSTGKKSGNQNRFIPVVKFLGPFELKAGKKATHSFQMPNYVGSVRVMVVAGMHGAYGQTEKTVPVRQDLMVLGTLPRVIGPNETFALPVSLFAMKDKVKLADITVETNDLLKISGANTAQLNFSKPGELQAYFTLTSVEKTGKAYVKISAKSGQATTYYETWLDIRLPNPEISMTESVVVKPGETWTSACNAIGVEGTNSASVEVSNMPQFNLTKRLNYLIQYPHGCIEQTTSSVFPQLYLDDVVSLSPELKKKVEANIKAGIKRIRTFQTYSGGFAYWSGESQEDSWGTNYAGHFLLEAKAKGYAVPDEVIQNFIKFQNRAADEWRSDYSARHQNYYSDILQSYRLFTLALAGKPNLGAMNRLFSDKNIDSESRIRLALAYQLAGRSDIATRLMNGFSYAYANVYDEYSYGDGYRNLAMVTEALAILGNIETAKLYADILAEELGSDRWYSTQTTAFSLIALSRFIKATGKDAHLSYSITIQSKKEDISSLKALSKHEFIPEKSASNTIQLKNNGKGLIYVKLNSTGIPLENNSLAQSNHINLEIKYFDIDNQPLNPSRIKQGKDFIAEVRVEHASHLQEYKNLALTQIFPSGWEIRNTRFEESSPFADMSVPRSQDIRDDRVYTYFSLERGDSKVFRIMLHAAYEGHFYLPSVSCEEMYRHEINALVPGQWVDVVK